MARAMWAVILAALLVPLAVNAETAYVTDNLRLGIHQAPDTSDRAFKALDSGQELEILSQNRNYAHVRLPDGAEGYVKAAYLVTEKPAKLIVAETQAANEDLQTEIRTLKAAFAEPAATIASLQQELEVTAETAKSGAAQIAELTASIDDYRSRQGRFKYSLPLTWVGGAMFVCLLAGFLGGLWWVDRSSRRRHGGIRIY